MTGVIIEFRQALARIRRRPAAFITTATVLALAVGVNGVLWATVHSALLRPLPYPEPEQLVALQDPRTVPDHYLLDGEVASGFIAFKREALSVGAYRLGVAGEYSLLWNGPTGPTLGVEVSRELFNVLKVRPIENTPSVIPSAPQDGLSVAYVSLDLWRAIRRQATSGSPVTLELSGESVLVVGVMPAGFWFPTFEHRFWVIRPDSIRLRQTGYSLAIRRESRNPELSLDSIEMVGVALDEARGRPKRWWRRSTFEELNTPADASALVLSALAGLALAAISIVTLIVMTAASGARERRADWIRWALGARRFDRIRPLVAEASVLSIGAGLIGLAMSLATISLMGGVLNRAALAAHLLESMPFVASLGLVISVVVAVCSGIVSAVSVGVMANELTVTTTVRSAGSRIRPWVVGISVVLGLGVLLAALSISLLQSSLAFDPADLSATLGADDTWSQVGALVLGMDFVALLGVCVAIGGLFGQRLETRRRDLQIRAALGASPSRVAYTLLQDAVWPLLFGVAGGAIAGYVAIGPTAELLAIEVHSRLEATVLAALVVSAAVTAAILPTAFRAARLGAMTSD